MLTSPKGAEANLITSASFHPSLSILPLNLRKKAFVSRYFSTLSLNTNLHNKNTVIAPKTAPTHVTNNPIHWPKISPEDMVKMLNNSTIGHEATKNPATITTGPQYSVAKRQGRGKRRKKETEAYLDPEPT